MADPVLDATQRFVNADPILGSVIAVLMVACAFLVHWVKSLLSELAAARREHLEDARKFATDSAASNAVITANTEQTRAAAEAIRTLAQMTHTQNEIVRERQRG